MFKKVASTMMILVFFSCTSDYSQSSFNDSEYQRVNNERKIKIKLDSETSDQEERALGAVGFFGKLAKFFQ